MDIIESKSEAGPVLAINRSLDRTNARDLDQALQVLFGATEGPVWLDVAGLQSLDSAGLTTLLRWHRKALTEERRFALVGANAFHRKLLEITRLDRELVLFDRPGGRRLHRPESEPLRPPRGRPADR